MTDKKSSSAIVAMAAIIAIAVLIYFWYKSKKDPEDPGWVNPDPEVPNPEIPGHPEFWSLEITAPDGTEEKNLALNLPGPVHLSSISGWVTINNPRPGVVLKNPIGYSIYAVKTGGISYKIGGRHVFGGTRCGRYAFNSAPGLNDVEYILVQIDRFYGGPWDEDVYRVKKIEAELTVFVEG